MKLNEDELRICQSLLADTNLKARFGDSLSPAFLTTIGTPQGDGLSPILFAIYLERALRDVRTQALPLRPATEVKAKMPSEAIYADDCDFISYSQQWLEYLERIIPPTIGDYQLQANTGTWWERTTIASKVRSKESPVSDPSIQSLGRVGAWTRGANEWKSTRKLGSFLGDEEDVQRRIQLATVQFKALDKLWKQSHSVPVETRLRLYKALVLPVLTYNAGTWGITQQVAGRLDAFHRKQLREVVRVKWPMRISNEALYEQCSSTRISLLIDRAR